MQWLLVVKKKMKKHQICRSIIIATAIISTLTGCNKQPAQTLSPESAQLQITAFMDATIENPTSTLKPYATLLEDYKILDDHENEYMCQLLNYSLRNMSYSITKITIEENIATIDLQIRAKDIGVTLSATDLLTDYISKAEIMTENETEYTEFNNKIIEIILDNMMRDKAKTISSAVTVQMEYDNGWKFVPNKDFMNAIYGDIARYDSKIANKYKDIEKPEEPSSSEITTSTETPATSITEKPTESTITSESQKTTTETPTQPSTSKDNPTTTTKPNEPEKIEIVYIADEDDWFKDELKPNDIEHETLPKTNHTTFSSRKKPIAMGVAATYDNTDYFAPPSRYGIELTVSEVIKGQAAMDILLENNEAVSLRGDYSYILIKVNAKLVVNNTGEESVQISYLDFDLLNYDNKTQPAIKLKNMAQFQPINNEQNSTSGYICFKYMKGDNINLAFKETADNTLWFSLKP